MTPFEAGLVERDARAPARLLVLLLASNIVIVWPALRFTSTPWLRVLVAYSAFPVLLVALFLAWRLRRASPQAAPRLPLFVGIAILVATAAFDMIVTIVHSPDLAMESNPYARMLLDSGHAPASVIAFSVAAQALLIVLMTILWMTWLVHVEPLRVLAWELCPKNAEQFVAAVTRGSTDTSLWWGLRRGDYKGLTWYRGAMFIITFYCVVEPLVRVDAGMGWLGLSMSNGSRLVVMLVAALGARRLAWWLVWRRGNLNLPGG